MKKKVSRAFEDLNELQFFAFNLNFVLVIFKMKRFEDLNELQFFAFILRI